MDAAKTAVRHNSDNVVLAKFRGKVLDNGIGVGKTHHRFALKGNIGDGFIDIENLAEFTRFRSIVYTSNDDIVGIRKCFTVWLLKNSKA